MWIAYNITWVTKDALPSLLQEHINKVPTMGIPFLEALTKMDLDQWT